MRIWPEIETKQAKKKHNSHMRAPDLIRARPNAGTKHEQGEYVPNSNGTDAKRARISHLKPPNFHDPAGKKKEKPHIR